ncbi:MAG: chromate efflux transporter [Chitinophagaceae bacterium]|nr:chromate efflux transporter [Chitinophagaceae bacterium]
MKLIRHIGFLKEVFFYTLTAFGGPQGHFGMMLKTFVEKRKDVSEKELIDLIAFCQMLPGPSSSQTITLIGYKRGGIILAILSLLIWILPAAILMTAFSFLIIHLDKNLLSKDVFVFVKPMAVGFIVYASLKAQKISVKSQAAIIIMICSMLATIFIRSPWVFPILIILGGVITNFTNKKFPPKDTKAYTVKWKNIFWFFLVFILAGFFSEFARVHHWQYARLFNLFENFYRFGSTIFGGGQALYPMMHEQFISLPQIRNTQTLMTNDQFMTGIGMVNAIPGPVFSICSYVGGLSMSSFGFGAQLAGSFVALIGVFLPSTLLLFFFFPIYQNLKQYPIIFCALEGLNSVVAGILWASAFILFRSLGFNFEGAMIILGTFLLLQFTKIPPPIIVLCWLILGFIF